VAGASLEAGDHVGQQPEDLADLLARELALLHACSCPVDSHVGML
jgi:hypothetical protein